jgi:hypothetical protein
MLDTGAQLEIHTHSKTYQYKLQLYGIGDDVKKGRHLVHNFLEQELKG